MWLELPLPDMSYEGHNIPRKSAPQTMTRYHHSSEEVESLEHPDEYQRSFSGSGIAFENNLDSTTIHNYNYSHQHIDSVVYDSHHKPSYEIHEELACSNGSYDINKQKLGFDQKLGLVTKMLQDLANDVQLIKPDHLDPSSFVQYITRTTSDLKRFMGKSFPPYSPIPPDFSSVQDSYSEHHIESFRLSQQKRKRFQPIDSSSQYSRTPPADVPTNRIQEKQELSQFHPVNESPLDYFIDHSIKDSYNEEEHLDYYTKKQKVVGSIGSIPGTNDILDSPNPHPQVEVSEDIPLSTRRQPRRVSQRQKSADYSGTDEDDYEYGIGSWNTKRSPDADKKKDKKKPSRTRLPKNTVEEWGFGPEDIKREFELELQRSKDKPSDKRGYKWARIAKRIGNERFLASGDCGTKLKAILRRHYPNLVGLKIKIPDDPKKEWGFTSQDVIEKIDELTKQGKKVSLSKIGYLLGHKTSDDERRKAFSERCDRGQLVHALLQYDYPEVAKRFERGNKKGKQSAQSSTSSPTQHVPNEPEVKKDPMANSVEDDSSIRNYSYEDRKSDNEEIKPDPLAFSPELMMVNTPTITNSPLTRIEMMSISGETPPNTGHSPSPLSNAIPSDPGLGSISPPPIHDIPLLEGLEGSYNVFLHNSTPGTSPVVEISSV